MVDKKYRNVSNLLFQQSDDVDTFAPNERTKFSGDISITNNGNIHSGCNGGAVLFRSPTTPRLEYLHGINESIYVEIVYTGRISVQFWAYPCSHSGRLMDEQSCHSRSTQTVYIPINIDGYHEGYFDVLCQLHSECAVFSMAIVAEDSQKKFTSTRLNTLINYIFPQKNICTEEQLYFRGSEGSVYYSYTSENICIAPYAFVEFSTYFNSFSCGKWVNNTVIDDIYCNVNFQGTCIVEVWHALSAEQQYKIYAGVHEQSEAADVCLFIGKSGLFGSGIIYTKIYALSETRVYGGSYATSTAKVSDINLGIVITTYKREEDVKKTVATLAGALPSVLKEASVEIVVVDNGQTLQAEDVGGATLIPNRNLGGSGGFMRGLIHLEDGKRFTHCLFMDDDAFCEPESVARAHALLSFRREDNLAVAGAMLLQENMHIQHENGAYFDYTNHPIGCGLDLNVREIVVQNEQSHAFQGMYGAWWFFAFPIAHIKHYAFPFFVRGDDILFSLSNKFSITTMNGICSWQENFENKHKAVTVYLGIRSILLINCCVNSYFIERLYILFGIAKYILRSLLSYNYYEAEAIMLAMKDFMNGPNMWVKNIDMQKKMKSLKQLDGKINYFILEGNDVYNNCLHAQSFRNVGIVQLLTVVFTLNGHIFPDAFLDKSKYFLYSNERYWLSAIWRKKNILVFNLSNSCGCVLEKSTKKFFACIYKFMLYAACFVLSSGKVYRKYRQGLGGMTSRTFWTNQFKTFD